MSTDDPKRTPNAPFHPPGVGRYPAVDDRLTTKVEAAPSWAIKMQEGINANHKLVVEEIHGIRADVEALKEWRKTGKHQPLMILPDGTVGPKPTPSGELRRVSENDLKQDAVIAQILVKQTATDAKVDGLVASQAAQTNNISVIKDTQAEVKSAVTGFMKQHPEISSGIATLLGLLIALATQWFQAKVHP